MSEIEYDPSGKSNSSFQSNIFVIQAFKIKFVSKLANEFVRLICLTIVSVHKDSFRV